MSTLMVQIMQNVFLFRIKAILTHQKYVWYLEKTINISRICQKMAFLSIININEYAYYLICIYPN